MSVNLCPLLKEDLPEMYKWVNDRNMVSFSYYYHPVTPEQHLVWYEKITNAPDTYIFAIRNGTELVGTTQLHSINPVHRSAELQIRIGREENTNKGYGTAAVRQVLSFAFNDLNLNRVFVTVFETNHRALRVYERAGFIKEGVLRKAAFIGGKYLNVIIMGILASDWRGS